MNRMKQHFDSAPPSAEQGNMAGFDAEFTDIVDYILRITYRIWEGKQIGLCYDYYSKDCPVYTLAGYSEGAEEIVNNTLKTLAAFPDRTLHAENIIWGGDDQQGFHTSHLIATQMTNLGASEFGPATGNKVAIPVIAHCVVKNNRIIEEWLVRDNYALVEQLGLDPNQVAANWANAVIDPAGKFAQWREAEITRVMTNTDAKRIEFFDTAAKAPQEFIAAALQNLWNARMLGDVYNLYADNARLRAPAARQLSGHEEIITFYTSLLGAIPDGKLSLDYVCVLPIQTNIESSSKIANSTENDAMDIAVRWTFAGHHLGSGRYGEPTGAPTLVIGESQYRVENNQIVEEITVFDELAILTQVYRARLAADD